MNHHPTPYPELNEVLRSLVADIQAILGPWFVGAYLQGSFALGDSDLHSDCDFLVVVKNEPTPEQLGRLVLLHDDLPTRDGHWTRHLEGSYAPAREIRDLSGLGREWWYVDHGWRCLQRSTHCNSEVVRWTLRERGITVDGPPPATLISRVPPEALRARMRATLPTLVPDLLSWASLEIAWCQRYLVATACRMLFTLATAEVTSKRKALDWALTRLDPTWERLLRQVLEDRQLGFAADQRPRPGAVEQSLAFVTYAQELARDW